MYIYIYVRHEKHLQVIQAGVPMIILVAFALLLVVVYYTILYYTILYYTILYHIISYYSIV